MWDKQSEPGGEGAEEGVQAGVSDGRAECQVLALTSVCSLWVYFSMTRGSTGS